MKNMKWYWKKAYKGADVYYVVDENNRPIVPVQMTKEQALAFRRIHNEALRIATGEKA
jgi:hypothetical protein